MKVHAARAPMHTVQINRKGANRVHSGHPWVFASDVEDRGEAQAGDAVRVVGPRHETLGSAHYSSTSQITLRMLSTGARAEEASREFFAERFAKAAALRELVVRDSDAYRLISSEGDLLPGLIVDKYGPYFVVQTLSQGMDRELATFARILVDEYAAEGIVARNDAAVRTHESLAVEKKVVHGEVPDRVPMRMNGLTMYADLLHGQKTGVFLDQRENYPAAARFAKPGGRALDCFTSTGGFALHLSRICEHVEAVDSSALALEVAAGNAKANGIENIEWKQADVFELLSAYSKMRTKFDTIVLDPPAFAKSRSAVQGALRGYKDINLRALRLLEPGGILVTCSCSHHISEADLLGVAAEASLDAGRTLRVLDRRIQSQDHPVLLTVPETLYLKCVILQVVA
ncbi:SAM-dependent methyltransferase [Bryobacterales bacterium F-183]|nr:SAM-dependent methyltransferase [Bryobacterales bacterium F-183]